MLLLFDSLKSARAETLSCASTRRLTQFGHIRVWWKSTSDHTGVVTKSRTFAFHTRCEIWEWQTQSQRGKLKKRAEVAENVSKSECKWSCCWENTKCIPHKHPPEGWKHRLLLVETLEHTVSLARCSDAEMDSPPPRLLSCVKAANAWLIINQYSAASRRELGAGCARTCSVLKHLQPVRANPLQKLSKLIPLNASNPLCKHPGSCAQTWLYRCECACMLCSSFLLLFARWCARTRAKTGLRGCWKNMKKWSGRGSFLETLQLREVEGGIRPSTPRSIHFNLGHLTHKAQSAHPWEF